MKKYAIRYGLLLLLGLIAYFLFMHLIGLSDVTEWRLLNGIIHFFAIWWAVSAYRKEFPESVGNHISGTALGMYTSVVGTIPFVVFLILFLDASPGLMEAIRNNPPFVGELSPFRTGLFVFVEGIVIGLIGSYIVTRVVDYRIAGNDTPAQA